MNLNILRAFRHAVYCCFVRAGDALFNTMDALMTENQIHSFPELSLSPCFQRHCASLYEAFEDGRIDEGRLRRVLAHYLPRPTDVHEQLCLALDASSIARPGSRTSADRSLVHTATTPTGCTPAVAGWQFSTLVVVPAEPSSWTYVLDQRRIPSDQTPIQVACSQIKDLMQELGERPLLLLDRGYDSAWLWCQLSGQALDVLIRLKSNRCFFRPAPQKTGRVGAPRKDGACLQPQDEGSHQNPDGAWEGEDGKGRLVHIRWWNHLHLKDARYLDLTVIEVVTPWASNRRGDERHCWLVYQGQERTDDEVVQVALSYARRFSQEHGYRFDKQELLWDLPRLRTPEQFERWSWIVALVHNQVLLARSLVQAKRHEWESKHRVPSPGQVRRGLGALLPELGTPAPPPKRRGNAKGRMLGAQVKKAPRLPVIIKAAKSSHRASP